jgi:hypothetical protein
MSCATPYLWPFKTHLINGVRWGQPWLIAVNYAVLVVTYATYVARNRREFKSTMKEKLSS